MDVTENVEAALKQIMTNQADCGRLRTQLDSSKHVLSEIQAQTAKVESQLLPTIQQMDSSIQQSSTSIHDLSSHIQKSFQDTENLISEAQSQVGSDFDFVKEALQQINSKQTELQNKLKEALENSRKTTQSVQEKSKQLMDQFNQPLQELTQFLDGDFRNQLVQDQRDLQAKSQELAKGIREGLIHQADGALAKAEKRLQTTRETLEKRKAEIKKAGDKASAEANSKLQSSVQGYLTKTEGKVKDTVGKLQKLTNDIRTQADRTATVMKGFGTASKASGTGLECLCGLVNEVRTTLHKVGIDV